MICEKVNALFIYEHEGSTQLPLLITDFNHQVAKSGLRGNQLHLSAS